MNTPRISVIAAIGKNRELGKQGNLIWKFTTDFEHLKSIVRGKPLIMGRKTYESIGIELPYSPSIVITSQSNYTSPYKTTRHTHLATSLDQALTKAKKFETDEIIVFGGAQIYTEALPLTDRLYLTVINETDKQADTFFPDYDVFKKIVTEHTTVENGTTLTFQTLEK